MGEQFALYVSVREKCIFHSLYKIVSFLPDLKQFLYWVYSYTMDLKEIMQSGPSQVSGESLSTV